MNNKKETIAVICIAILTTILFAYIQFFTSWGMAWGEDMKHCGGTIMSIQDCREYLDFLEVENSEYVGTRGEINSKINNILNDYLDKEESSL